MASRPFDPAGEINYRANIDAMKRAGVTDLVSVSACGSFREELSPGTFVLVDQFIDRTFAREKELFWSSGCVAHVPMADPVSPLLVEQVEKAAKALKDHPCARRHLSGHGGAAIFHPGREFHVSLVGLRCHWHDQYARSQAGA